MRSRWRPGRRVPQRRLRPVACDLAAESCNGVLGSLTPNAASASGCANKDANKAQQIIGEPAERQQNYLHADARGFLDSNQRL
jgi:hypothetical protein